LNCNFLGEPLDRVSPLELLKLNRSILVKELIDREVSTSNSDFDTLLLNLDGDSLGTELVNAFSLSHEHDLELGPLRVVVDELSQLLIDLVVSDWNVNSYSLL